ncbi:MAG: hypothetical protein AAF547_06670 [Actinomycetota bacterium]
MPTQLKKPSIQLGVLLAGIVVLVGFAFGLSSAGLTGDADAAASATLDVDGVAYRFTPSTCTITEDDFLAAGSGTVDGESFWLAVSSDGINLAVGPETESELPADDQLWLVSVEEIRWLASDGTVTASVGLRDERDLEAERLQSRLSLTCPTV